jgi:ATP-dependent helicase HrpA
MHQGRSKTAFKVKTFKDELAGIVPPDFLEQFNTAQVESAIRYCRGLQIRIERAYAAPDKDRTKASQLQPYASRLQELAIKEPSPECRRLLREYEDMLAEYKISLFAQEMKTRFPVSTKRLDKKWQEIINSC